MGKEKLADYTGSVTAGDHEFVIKDGVVTDKIYFGTTVSETPSLEQQIRQIVREEIAAQKEQLFEEARQYNIKTNLDLFEEAQAIDRDTP